MLLYIKNDEHIDGATVVYATAGMGVVHNLRTNTQLFYDGHKDDITCITISVDGALVATGCMGKDPVVEVWPTDIKYDESKYSLITVGRGHFKRGICAVEFSYDNSYIFAVGCDDHHAIGVFDIAKGGELVAESVGPTGIPPKVFWMKACPAPQFSQYICREIDDASDIARI